MRKLIDGEWMTAEEICEKHKKMVYRVAGKFARHAPFDDLVSEGMMGLLRAYEIYDETKGNKFITYATQAIQSRIMRFYNGWTLGPHYPHHIRDLSVTIRKRDTEKTKSPEQLAEEIGTTVARVEAAISYMNNRMPVSINAEIDDDEDATLAHYLPADPDDDTQVIVDEFLAGLSKVQRVVATGLLERKTFDAIARDNHLTKAAVENAKEQLQAALFLYRNGREIGTYGDITAQEIYESGYFQQLPADARSVVEMTAIGIPLAEKAERMKSTKNKVTHHLRKARMGYAKWSVFHGESIG